MKGRILKTAGFCAILCGFLSAGLIQNARASETLKLPLPQTETLPNGLRIVWFTSDRLPVVDLQMVFKSGSRDDPKGKSGTANLVAATLDEGAGGLTERQIGKRIESLGASRSISTDDDFFTVSLHGLAPDADVFLGLLAKMVLHPDFPADQVNHEKARMLDSWNGLSDYGDSLVDLAFQRELTQGTPYARGAILSAHELSGLTRDDLVAYQKKNFTPKNATLMVVGRVNRDAFRKKILSYFADWKGDAPHESDRAYRSLSFTPRSGEVLLINRPDLTQAQVRLGFRAPSVRDPRHYPLAVTNAFLGGYFHSRLNELIRDKLGLTYGISSSFDYNRDLATFTISSATRNQATGELIHRTLGVLRGLVAGPIGADEVKTAKEYLIGGFPLSAVTLESVANQWLTCELYGLGPNRLNEYVPRVQQVNLAEVSSAVKSSFDLKHLIIAVAGDAKTIAPVLKKAGFRVHLISPKSLIDGKI